MVLKDLKGFLSLENGKLLYKEGLPPLEHLNCTRNNRYGARYDSKAEASSFISPQAAIFPSLVPKYRSSKRNVFTKVMACSGSSYPVSSQFPSTQYRSGLNQYKCFEGVSHGCFCPHLAQGEYIQGIPDELCHPQG